MFDEPGRANGLLTPAGEAVWVRRVDLRRGGFCRTGQENLCERARFTGYTSDGGYHPVWHERTLCSVANLTRRDGEEFLQLAPRIPIHTETQAFPLDQANEALARLREGRLQGAAVLVP